MYKAKGKKIPNDIIKDQATRQAFDRVEARLKDIEAAIDSSNKAVSGIVYYTVTAAFQEIPGLNVKLTVDGKHDVFVGLKYAQAATAINFRVLNAAGTDAKATYKFLRNGVAIDTLSFFEMTATGATAVALYLPP